MADHELNKKGSITKIVLGHQLKYSFPILNNPSKNGQFQESSPPVKGKISIRKYMQFWRIFSHQKLSSDRTTKMSKAQVQSWFQKRSLYYIALNEILFLILMDCNGNWIKLTSFQTFLEDDMKVMTSMPCLWICKSEMNAPTYLLPRPTLMAKLQFCVHSLTKSKISWSNFRNILK